MPLEYEQISPYALINGARFAALSMASGRAVTMARHRQWTRARRGTQRGKDSAERKDLVPLAGLEPALLAELDFEAGIPVYD